MVVGISYEVTDEPMDIVFARTYHGDWFGLGRYEEDMLGVQTVNDWFCCGLLDVDNSLTELLQEG